MMGTSKALLHRNVESNSPLEVHVRTGLGYSQTKNYSVGGWLEWVLRNVSAT